MRCDECGREMRPSEDARKWRALLTTAPADDVSGHADNGEEVAGVAVYCPECFEREFG